MQKFITLERSHHFVKRLYPKLSKIENPFKDQLKRSSLSIALNLAEGQAKRGADRKRFYKIAYASARETMCCMQLLNLEICEIDRICAMIYKLEQNSK